MRGARGPSDRSDKPRDAMTPRDYAPILTGKPGEFKALNGLDPAQAQRVWPLFDMPPINEKGKNGNRRPVAPPEKPIGRLLADVSKVWTAGGRVGVDVLALGAGTPHPVELLLERAEINAARVQAAIRTDAPDSYIDAVAACRHLSPTVTIRLRVDAHRTPQDAVAAVRRIMSRLELPPANAHLTVDLGRTRGLASRHAADAAARLDAFDDLNDFRLVSVASSSMPATAKDIPREPPFRLPRTDRRMWEALVPLRGTKRVPLYGDYGITGPRPEAAVSGGSAPEPRLRYTTDAAVLIWRGRKSDDPPDDGATPNLISFSDLCKAAVQHDDFDPSLSPGDQEIVRVAAGSRGAGNASQWIEWTTSHHVAHVLGELERSLRT